MAQDSLSILVVGANATERSNISRTLAAGLTQSLEIREAETGAAALAAATIHPQSELILLDPESLDVTAVWLLHALRQGEEVLPMAVVGLTAASDDDQTAELLANGAQACLAITQLNPTVLSLTVRHAVERQRLVRRIHVCESRFRTISNLTSDFTYSLRVVGDGTLRQEWIAGAFEKITGYAMGQEGAEFFWRFMVHPADLPKVLQRYERLQAGQEDECEFRIVARGGHVRWLRNLARPVLDENGQLIRIVGVVRDITQQRLSEIELRQSESALRSLNYTLERRVEERTAELERSNAELDRFAYIASHDLKSPLRAIKLLAHWAEEDADIELPQATRMHLAKIDSRITRMERLLDDLLSYSRIGRIEQKAEPVNLGEMIQNVIAIESIPPTFKVTVDEELPTLFTAAVPLQTVLRNLISNAIKHHDRPIGTIDITVEDKGDEIEIAVTDDGPGIAPHFHERIFDMFQTLKPRDVVEGSGMGLALVKKILESRRSWIGVESGQGRGTTFRFGWPKNELASST